ncbi:MAG: sugar transporter [Bacteroidota bacterium]
MSRISQTIKNAKIGILYYLAVLAANFFSRKYFLDYLGDEFIGLVSTLRSFVDFLNLAELGIGTAVGFALYRPLYKKNHSYINEIVGLVGFLYKRIGLFVFIGGLILSIFFSIIFEKVDISLFLVYFSFFIFLTNALFGYFFNYHLVLFEADQKGYIIISYYQGANLVKLILQTVLVFYFESAIVWLLLEFSLSLFYAIMIRQKVKKEYTWLLLNYKVKKALSAHKEIVTKIKQTFVHKISSFVLSSTDQLLIFSLVNIQSVTFYGNYQLIFLQINALLENLFKNNGASIGNLVAEGNKKHIDDIFWELMTLRFLMGGFFSMSLYFLLDSFIVLWIGSKYILSETILILMSINFLISQIRKPVENFKNAYGLFADTWAPVVEMIINLVISFYLGSILGIEGILYGTLLSVFLIVLIWKPYYLYKYGFQRSFKYYFPKYLKLIFCLVISFIISRKIIDFLGLSISDFVEWIYAAVLYCLIILVSYSVPLFLFTKGFRKFLIRIHELLIRLYK